ANQTDHQFEKPIMKLFTKNYRDIKFVRTSPPFSPGLSQGQTRLALVIGNGRYKHVSKLTNPENDATDMAKALNRLGFEVIEAHNSTHQGMVQALEDFSQRLKRNKGVGLFYYAGHGIGVSGKNYLLPVDAKIEKPSDIRFETMDLARVLEEMAAANNPLNIVVLDACRDNPFMGSFRNINRGLAQISAPSGTWLAYATAPGDVAADGGGRNGIYTKNLLNHLEKPGLSIETLFKKVRQDVMKETNDRQVPWESSSLLGEFYFAGNIMGTVTTKGISKGKSPDECKQPKVDQRPVSCLFGG
ncbi:MAG: caspase family protein, partial [Psychrosphaera sp.]|nr:caspase family protein [Psychrosphaera sp.]